MMQQNQEEFDWLLRQIAGARSILEIGSYDGASLQAMATAAAPGALLRSIDDNRHDTAGMLSSVIEAQGYTTDEMMVGYPTPPYGWMGIGIVEVRP